MTRLPALNFRTMEKALLNLGFEPVRQKGSHVFFRHPNGRGTSVPNHPGRDIPRPLVHEILREIGMTTEQFMEELEKG